MNLERISFRTNESERQFLSRLNKEYKCKDITSLMHRVFQDFDKQSEPSKTPPLIEVFGDLGKPSISEIVRANKDKRPSHLEAIFPDIMSPEMWTTSAKTSDAEEKREPRPGAVEVITDQLSILMRFREIQNRALPPGYRHF